MQNRQIVGKINTCMVHDCIEEIYNMYGDHIVLFMNMIIISMRNFYMHTCGVRSYRF